MPQRYFLFLSPFFNLSSHGQPAVFHRCHSHHLFDQLESDLSVSLVDEVALIMEGQCKPKSNAKTHGPSFDSHFAGHCYNSHSAARY